MEREGVERKRDKKKAKGALLSHTQTVFREGRDGRRRREGGKKAHGDDSTVAQL